MNKTMQQDRKSRLPRRRRGFTLLEVLLLVGVLGVVGAAAGQAMQVAAKIPSETDMHFQIETRLISKMEEIRAMQFDAIAVGNPSTLSDEVPIGPKDLRYDRRVVVSFADPGNGLALEAYRASSVDTFKKVTVTCGGQSATIFITKYGANDPSAERALQAK